MSKGSPLFKRLARTYERTPIDYPQLKAVTLAQWALESGWGTSGLATRHLNFGGLKYRPEMAPYAKKVRYQAHDGGDDYCKFGSLEEFITGYWAFLQRSPYAGWEEHTRTPADFIGFIGPIYCPGNEHYVAQILALVPETTHLLEAEAEGTDTTLRPPAGPPEEPSRRPGLVRKFAVDPGHGMSNRRMGIYDPGAVHQEGSLEYEEATLALKYGLALRDALLARGQQVFMTRDDAQDHAPVGQRAANAEEAGCEVFISLHLNDFDDDRANGLEVLYRDQEDAGWAGKLHDALCDLTGLKPRGGKPRTDLAVLKFDGPAVLIELGFIANDRDRELLLNPAKRQAICEKIAEVTLAYFA